MTHRRVRDGAREPAQRGADRALGHEKHDPAGAGTGNIRNGTRPQTVLAEASGDLEIDVPPDRAATFEPQLVRERHRRLNGVDEVVLSHFAEGPTTGGISAKFGSLSARYRGAIKARCHFFHAQRVRVHFRRPPKTPIGTAVGEPHVLTRPERNEEQLRESVRGCGAPCPSSVPRSRAAMADTRRPAPPWRTAPRIKGFPVGHPRR